MTRFAPLWQQNNQYPASADRGLLGLLYPTAASSGHTVTAVTNTMNVSVALGSTVVPLAANQGTVLCRSDAAEVVTLQTAPGAGQSRYDVITVQVRDATLDAGGNNDWIVGIVQGVAAASPAVPAVPNNATPLANVLVPGNVVNLNTATVTSRRTTLYTPADIANAPKGVLAQVQGTVSVVGAAPSAALIITTAALAIPAGRRIQITYTSLAQSSGAGLIDSFELVRDTTTLCQYTPYVTGGGSGRSIITFTYVDTPPGPSHTYLIRLSTNVTAAGVDIATAGQKRQLVVTDLG